MWGLNKRETVLLRWREGFSWEKWGARGKEKVVVWGWRMAGDPAVEVWIFNSSSSLSSRIVYLYPHHGLVDGAECSPLPLDFRFSFLTCFGPWDISRYDMGRSLKCSWVGILLCVTPHFQHGKNMPGVFVGPSAMRNTRRTESNPQVVPSTPSTDMGSGNTFLCCIVLCFGIYTAPVARAD